MIYMSARLDGPRLRAVAFACGDGRTFDRDARLAESKLKEDIEAFVSSVLWRTSPYVQIWGRLCARQWVALSDLLGTDVPAGWPALCLDVEQHAIQRHKDFEAYLRRFPPADDGPLAEAIAVRDAHAAMIADLDREELYNSYMAAG